MPILEPARRSKLQLEWNGPYKVMRRVSEVDYEVQTPGQERQKPEVDAMGNRYPAVPI